MQEQIDALVIASHPDDAEIGVGGILALLAAAGKKTGIIDLTNGEPTPYGTPEKRAIEAANAASILKVSTRQNLNCINREIADCIETRKTLANAIRTLRPTLLFLPFWEDAHPDHIATANLAIAARFYSKFVKSDLIGEPWWPKQIFHYFGFHLRSKAVPSFIVSIDQHMETKMAAIRAYESQFVAHQQNQKVLSDIEADARYWGSRIYATYGEPLICREHLGVRSADALFGL